MTVYRGTTFSDDEHMKETEQVYPDGEDDSPADEDRAVYERIRNLL